jgi:glutamate-1-semialdehyde 2,1-aminomutase
LSAVAAREEILEQMVMGGVVFGGTFNGNCLSMAAAGATLTELARDGGKALRDANRLGESLMAGISRVAEGAGIRARVTGFGTAFAVHFTDRAVLLNYRDTLEDDRELLRKWLAAAMDEGVFLLPDGRMYTSAVHTGEDVERTLDALERAFRAVRIGS